MVTQCKHTVLRAAASECLTTSFATTFGFCGWLTDVSPLTFEDMKPSWSWAVSKILEWREEHSLHDGVMRTGWILHGCYKLRGWVLHLLRFASLIPIPMQGPKEDAVIPPGQNLRSHWVLSHFLHRVFNKYTESVSNPESRARSVPCFGACTESTSESRSQETKLSKWHVNHIMPSCRPQLNLEESSTRPSHLWTCFYFVSNTRSLCVPGELLSQDQVPI